jgi:hypothetical protein
LTDRRSEAPSAQGTNGNVHRFLSDVRGRRYEESQDRLGSLALGIVRVLGEAEGQKALRQISRGIVPEDELTAPVVAALSPSF